MDPHDIIKYPLSTEKSIRLLEAENKLLFVVDYKATRENIKKAVESMFKVKVVGMNILRRHIPAKSTGSKRLKGNASQAKYATLHLAKGQKIDLFDLKEEK